MQITEGLLKSIEQNDNIKKEYIGKGQWGQNQLVYIPILGIVAAVFGFLGLFLTYQYIPTTTLMMYVGILLAIILVCYLIIQKIQSGVKEKLAANIGEIPVAVAKIVHGNEEAKFYALIYTVGEKRHDITFVDRMVRKVQDIEYNEDAAMRKKINKIFRIRTMAEQTSQSTLLPKEFTEGEEVYMRHHIFYGEELLPVIEANEGRFIVMPFTYFNVPVLQRKHYS